MKQIAALAGVTAATVSMSLSNSPRISPATRLRVWAIARQLRYQPNPYVSALMRSRRQRKPLNHSPILALVCVHDTPDGWRESASLVLRQMREGALERAVARGYQGREFWLHQDGMSNERFSEMLHARSIQGILIGPSPQHPLALNLQWERFSIVSIGGSSAHPAPLPAVSNDHYLSGLRAVEECHQLGYRRPGLILRRAHNRQLLNRWEAGFLTAQRNFAGLAALAPLLVDAWDDPRPVAQWLRREKPDVIIAPAPDVTTRLLGALGLRAPRDVGMACLSCPQPGSKYSGICQNGRLIGASAVDLLIGMVERNEKGLPEHPMALMIEGRWNPGKTLRRIPG